MTGAVSEAIRAFVAKLASLARLTISLMRIGKGLTVATKRQAAA